jgi:4-hydroxy-2-oxoheptanedioate aldolase
MTGLERCEEIAQVPGLDGLFIGPGDLGLSMGLGIGQDRTEPELTAAFARILAASRAAGGHAGMHAATTAYAAKMAGEGFDLVTVWVDAVAVGTTLTAADVIWREARG